MAIRGEVQPCPHGLGRRGKRKGHVAGKLGCRQRSGEGEGESYFRRHRNVIILEMKLNIQRK